MERGGGPNRGRFAAPATTGTSRLGRSSGRHEAGIWEKLILLGA